jgi:predicted O-methyltransferase YrrM
MSSPGPEAAKPEEERYFHWCISSGKPYFGPLGWSTQGQPARHVYMREVVKQMAKAAGRPLRILEVGSWAGGSAITFGKALQEFAAPDSRLVCVDPWTPYEFTRGNAMAQSVMRGALETGFVLRLFQHNIAAAGTDKVTITIRAHSAEVLPLLMPESFDIAFVDGDHRYEFVRDDLSLARKLIRIGGVLCGDDLEIQFAAVDQAQCKANRDEGFVPDPKTGVMFHPGVTLAVAEAFGPVAERLGFWAAQRTDTSSFTAYPLPDLGPSPTPPSHFSRHPDFVP